MAKPSISKRAAEVLAAARQAAETADSWIHVHNAVYGIGGAAGRLFPTRSERTRFAQTEEFAAIAALIGELRERGGSTSTANGAANGTIVVRLPRSVHAALLAEAEAEDVSLNQLCVAKLAMQLAAIA